MYKGDNRVRSIFSYIRSRLFEHVEPAELDPITYWVLEEMTGFSRAEVAADKPVILNEQEKVQLENILERLISGEPVQYVFGHTWFYGLEFHVDPNVLIPRPETEELVRRILTDHSEMEMSVLDIGTGSGCIPVAISNARPGWKVSACDKSANALSVARSNAELNKAKVEFFEIDILEKCPEGKYEVIVSNPPYIPGSEKVEMSKRVTGHEPGMALFVPDNDPLIFYGMIAEKARQILSEGGYIYFEIHSGYGQEVCNMLKEMDYKEIHLEKDLSGRDRIVSCRMIS